MYFLHYSESFGNQKYFQPKYVNLTESLASTSVPVLNPNVDSANKAKRINISASRTVSANARRVDLADKQETNAIIKEEELRGGVYRHWIII